MQLRIRHILLGIGALAILMIAIDWRVHRELRFIQGEKIAERKILDSVGLLCVEGFYKVDDLDFVKHQCVDRGMKDYLIPIYQMFSYNSKSMPFLTLQSIEIEGINVNTEEVRTQFMNSKTARELGINAKIGDKYIYYYCLSGHWFRKIIVGAINSIS